MRQIFLAKLFAAIESMGTNFGLWFFGLWSASVVIAVKSFKLAFTENYAREKVNKYVALVAFIIAFCFALFFLIVLLGLMK